MSYAGNVLAAAMLLGTSVAIASGQAAKEPMSSAHWAEIAEQTRVRLAQVATEPTPAPSAHAVRGGLGGAQAEPRGVDGCGGDCFGVLEGEIAEAFCDDSINGGCLGAIPVFGTMEVGVPTCGLLNGQDGAPPLIGPCTDTDWYRIPLIGGTTYVIDIISEVDVSGGILVAAGNTPLPYDGDPFAFCTDAVGFLDGGIVAAACSNTRQLFTAPTTEEYVIAIFGPGGDIGVAHYELVIDSCAIECTGADAEGVPNEVADLTICEVPGWDPVNGGCLDPAFAFDTVQINVPLCGASDYTGVCRDTDWFLVDIPYAGDFDIELTCDRTMDVGVVLGNSGLEFTNAASFCPAVDFADAVTVLACTTDALRFTFPAAGRYVILVAPNFFFDPGERHYRLRVIGTRPPCPADINEDGAVDLADLQLLLFYFGTTTCP